MECSIAALIACFSWSNVYIDSGLSWQDAGVYSHFERYEGHLIIDSGEEIVNTWERSAWHTRAALNPYGRVALGYELSFPTVSWRIEASHVSSIDTGRDRGINAITISARWYPFR